MTICHDFDTAVSSPTLTLTLLQCGTAVHGVPDSTPIQLRRFPLYTHTQLIILSMQIKGYFAHVPSKEIQTNAAVTAPRYAKLANALFNSVLSYLTYLPFPLSISR